MATETTYTCDRCGERKVNDNMFLGTVGIVVGDFYGGGISAERLSRRAGWCLKCRVETGIDHPNRDQAVNPIDPPPTLEDLVRQIVREEIGNQ